MLIQDKIKDLNENIKKIILSKYLDSLITPGESVGAITA